MQNSIEKGCPTNINIVEINVNIINAILLFFFILSTVLYFDISINIPSKHSSF